MFNGEMTVGNVALRAGFKPTGFCHPKISMITITRARLPDAITLSNHTCLCDCLPESIAQTTQMYQLNW